MAWTPAKIVWVGGLGSLAAYTAAKVFATMAGEVIYGPSTSSFVYDGRWVGRIWERKKAEK